MMLTPPYHFSIVASPNTPAVRDESSGPSKGILYRGSTPAARNLPFLRRLDLRTIIYLKKKELDANDSLVIWALKRKVELRWVKASGMSEEKLGIGKTEVGDVLKTILEPSSYPLYIADMDGISHTTLIIACLRKLQGWHMDSIVDEIYRFEPEHEDLPLVPFITTYLSSSESPLILPQPPYPTWLWPSSSTLTPSLTPPAPPPTKRDRTTSTSQSTPQPLDSLLPYPHPLASRKHPTMRLTFPPVPSSGTASPLSLSRSNTMARVETRVEDGGVSLMGVMAGLAAGTEEVKGKAKEKQAKAVPARSSFFGTEDSLGAEDQSDATEVEAQSSIMADSSKQVEQIPAGVIDDEGMGKAEDQDEDDGEEEEEDDEDEEEDDEDEDGGEADLTSQYISALDLAGFG